MQASRSNVISLVFGKTDRLAIIFYCLFRQVKMPPSKFEANQMLHLQVRCTSFSLFPFSVFVIERLFPCIRDNLIFSLTGWFLLIRSHVCVSTYISIYLFIYVLTYLSIYYLFIYSVVIYLFNYIFVCY